MINLVYRMKIVILFCLLLINAGAYSQLDWKNYSTSFNGGKKV